MVYTSIASGKRAASCSRDALSVPHSRPASISLTKRMSHSPTGTSVSAAVIGDGLSATLMPRVCAQRMISGRRFTSFCSTSRSPGSNCAKTASICSCVTC